MQLYTAKLHHNTFHGKVLLTNIEDQQGNEFRAEDGHCWVDGTKLEKFIPTTNRYTTKIQFKAKELKYLKGGIEPKVTLGKFKQVQVIP